MNDQGWIKLHRKSMTSSIWQSPMMWMVWCWVLMKANHESHKFPFNGVDMEIAPGQFITGVQKACTEVPTLTPRKYRTAITYLKSTSRVTIKSYNKFSIVTVCGWSDYQASDKQDDKRATSKRQANDKQTTTYKKDKNKENDKNILSKDNMANAESNGFKIKTSFKGNPEIDEILSAYDALMGHPPTDRSPRRVAQNLRQTMHTLLKDLKEYRPELTFSDMVAKTFDWYDRTFDMKGDTLDVVRRKSRILFDATRKKYIKNLT